MSQNWRFDGEVGASSEDYFRSQKKQLQVADRRPVIRKSSDIVGPGIGATAVRITDFNNILATYNGYFSALPDAVNGPGVPFPEVTGFIGYTVMDSELGGMQVFNALGPNVAFEYTRTFVRNPGDEDSISWGLWRTSGPIPASTRPILPQSTLVPPGTPTYLAAADMEAIGEPGTYRPDFGGLQIQRQGVYTGYLRVEGPSALVIDELWIEHPDGSTNTRYGFSNFTLGGGITRPLTFYVTAPGEYVRVEVTHSTGSNQPMSWTCYLTRTGDAI